MASLNSSIIFWNEEEIVPRSILLISSGAVGDRLLFWQSTIAPHKDVQQEQTTRLADVPRQKIPVSSEPTSSSHSTASLNLPQCNHRGLSCPSPAGGIVGGHATNSASSAVTGSPHQAVTPSGEAALLCAGCANKTRLSGPASSAQRHPPPTVTASAAASSPATPSTSGNLNQSGASLVVAPTEMVVEGVPVSSLLSLLHPSTNELQHKIYVKLSTKVFIGVGFSLTKAIMETNGVAVVTQSSTLSNRGGSMPNTSNYATMVPEPPMDFTSVINFLRLKSPLPPPKYEKNQTQLAHCSSSFGGNNCKHSGKTVGQTVSSFAIVFVLNESAPPCVQSHYTELARLVGVQLRRSELYWQNLSSEREKISAILDRYAGILSSGEGQVDAREHDTNEGSSIDDSGEVNANCVNVGGTEGFSPLVSTHKGTSSEALEEDDPNKFDKHECSGNGHCDPWHVYAYVAKRSPLCSELAQILNQVASSGRVNVKINNRYSVFFCLPFKAYAIMPFELKTITTSKPCWPAIRPGAVWRAMQRLRPYHTLLLTTPKQSLRSCAESFPIDVNQSLESFVEDLSPIATLASISNRSHSQEDCLRVGLWLVYHGHAIIISPIVSSNAYTLAPLSHYWLQPKVLLHFATQFPKLNFAEVLSSFCDYYTLEEHLNGESPARFWRELTATECADLVAWLLRHRLIIQIHTYILSLLPRPNCDASDDSKNVSDSDRSVSSSSPTELAFARIHQGCGGALLHSALPTEADRERVLAHYQSTVRHFPIMLYLFLRLMTRLPAHLDELMFVESVDRQTLIGCMQLFSPFIVTIRLPDPVTACFAGIEWSH